MIHKYNRNLPVIGKSIPQPSQDAIEGSLNLRECDLVSAMQYGGPITRLAIGAMNLRYDHRYVVIDTKVSFLMKGFIPAIPGWHTDGVPRGDDNDPSGTGQAHMDFQETGGMTPPRYHLLVTGTHSQTEFINEPLWIVSPNDSSIYEKMNKFITDVFTEEDIDGPLKVLTAPSCTVVEWDWWNIHRAVPASASGWRYLIRVTETDYVKPRSDPADFIRTQTQVYVPENFGW